MTRKSARRKTRPSRADAVKRPGASSQRLINSFAVHSKRIADWANKLLQDRAEAEDTAQEVFLLVQKHAGQFRGQSHFSTWLYRITINAALQKLRRRERQRNVFMTPPGINSIVTVGTWRRSSTGPVASKNIAIRENYRQS
jgi:DNA-directed RNA polymerase specialized sigma24 family protein